FPLCGLDVGINCCQRFLDTGVWDCPECPGMRVEDCGIPNPNTDNMDWVNCITSCGGNSAAFANDCLNHFYATGEWLHDCNYWSLECDCDGSSGIKTPDQEEVNCLLHCGKEGISQCL